MAAVLASTVLRLGPAGAQGPKQHRYTIIGTISLKENSKGTRFENNKSKVMKKFHGR
jgi:hypothetical protein